MSSCNSPTDTTVTWQSTTDANCKAYLTLANTNWFFVASWSAAASNSGLSAWQCVHLGKITMPQYCQKFLILCDVNYRVWRPNDAKRKSKTDTHEEKAKWNEMKTECVMLQENKQKHLVIKRIYDMTTIIRLFWLATSAKTQGTECEPHFFTNAFNLPRPGS